MFAKPKAVPEKPVATPAEPEVAAVAPAVVAAPDPVRERREIVVDRKAEAAAARLARATGA